MAKPTDKEYEEIERSLRQRLNKLDIKPKQPVASDDFWSSLIVMGVITIAALAIIVLLYQGAK